MKKIPTVYPFVNKVIDPHVPAIGKFANGMPTGVSIHYSADRDLNRTIRTLKARNLGYHLIIDRDGTIVQTCYLDSRCSHAGPSIWNGLSCNRYHVAICVLSWGEVKKKPEGFLAWNSAQVPAKDVVYRPFNIGGSKGYWDAATDAQEKSLIDVLRWFLMQGISYSAICGHDEAASPPGRKIDPGGVIRWNMDELRAMLKPTGK